MRWLYFLLLSVLVIEISAFPRVRRQVELEDNDNLAPVNDESLEDPSEDPRDKRMLEGATQAKYGVKNALLGFVFGSVSPSPLPRKVTRRPATTRTTTTEDIPVFDRNKVALQFPGELFGPSVSLLIRSTKIVGSVIQNSAERYQAFLRLFRPLFRGVFAIKGLEPITTTTVRPTKKSKKTKKSTTPLSNEIR